MIPIAKPDLGKAEADAAANAVLSGWLSQGPRVAAFEESFARSVGAAHACAVANCTVALHLALLGVGVEPGDEVITPSHTFIACANAIRQVGAVPVFVDIDPATFNIDPDLIERAITPRTVAILCVHQMGMPADLAYILPLARAHGLKVIEDAACAAGSRIELNGAWQSVGAPVGDVACFSLHPRKVITAGEGGVLTTNDPKLDAKFRLLRQHGMTVSDATRHASDKVIYESYALPAFNYRMTDVQAAIASVQLTRLDDIVRRRRELATLYSSALRQQGLVEPPVEPSWARSNWQSYCVRLPKRVAQRDVMQSLLSRGIATRRGIMCIHREPAYEDLRARLRLPQSEAAQDRCVILPLYSQMSDETVLEVVSALGAALEPALAA